jgi:hypothetical protein
MCENRLLNFPFIFFGDNGVEDGDVVVVVVCVETADAATATVAAAAVFVLVDDIINSLLMFTFHFVSN